MKDEPARDIEEILAAYVDRLNDGERLDEETILAEDPVHGPEIFEHLEVFIESTIQIGEGDEDRACQEIRSYMFCGRGARETQDQSQSNNQTTNGFLHFSGLPSEGIGQ